METLIKLYMVSIGFNMGFVLFYMMMGGRKEIALKALPGAILFAPLVMAVTLAQLFPIGSKRD